jgi:hypothetical protein
MLDVEPLLCFESPERLDDLEFEWMWMWLRPALAGAAVHGRWSGECGDALTGRKKCGSERGEGMGKSRVRVGAVGRRGLLFPVRVAGCAPGRESGLSRSEQ